MKCVLAFALLLVVGTVWAGSNAASRQWLADNAQKEGVVVLPSGLQYRVLRRGEGGAHPTVDSPCVCKYAGRLITGAQFDAGTHTYVRHI
jgi:FKBP-type peptidyl-prolyl cis-trans isomerase FklB